MLDITLLPVATDLSWQIEFGLWLRQSPTQKRKERAQLSVQAYSSDIDQMAQWFGERYGVAFEPGQMNSANLQEYFSDLKDRCAPATYNRKLASLRMLIKWSRSVNVLNYDPSEWIPLQDATRKSPRDLCEEDRLKLEAVADAGEGSLIGLRDSVIFYLMNNAGLRISEVIGLKLSDLHLEDGYIHVFGKGGIHRNIEVGGRLVEKLRLWLERKPDSLEGTLITSDKGMAITRSQAWRRFIEIADQADVQATPHDMRHTYILRFRKAYMDNDESQQAATDALCQQTGDGEAVIQKYYTRARASAVRAAAEVM